MWVRCDVKPGPFSDERFVRIHSVRGDWVAFVGIGELEEPILEGTTFLRVIASNFEGQRFTARVAGYALGPSSFEGSSDLL